MAFLLGWICVAAIAASATVPLGFRIVERRRAAPDSQPIRLHVALGTATVILAFAHTLAALTNLGSSEAIGGGFVALMAGGVAFLIIMAHVGIGLQLRDVRLRDRVRKRRMHVATASLIVLVTALHVWLLRAGQ
jgi:multisubunit Na+/H+ antiporter MnhB subunit